MADDLYEFEQQFREKRAIWRLFEVAPLRYALARGRIFRWFGVHIPMHLVGMQGDVDLMMSLLAPPQRHFTQLYETWEIKTTLVARDGRIRSSKNSLSKKRQLLGQMKKYRQMGSPCHGLLDLFVFEDNALEELGGPPREAMSLVLEKAELMASENFGYRMIQFQHAKEDESSGRRDNFLGLKVNMPPNGYGPIPTLIPDTTTQMGEPFSVLTRRLEDFVAGEISSKRITYGNCVVTFCSDCSSLLAISPKGDYRCLYCDADLTLQIG